MDSPCGRGEMRRGSVGSSSTTPTLVGKLLNFSGLLGRRSREDKEALFYSDTGNHQNALNAGDLPPTPSSSCSNLSDDLESMVTSRRQAGHHAQSRSIQEACSGGDDDCECLEPHTHSQHHHQRSEAEAKSSRRWKWIGLLMILLASFSFALNSLVSKILMDKYPVFLVAFVRVQGVLYNAMACSLYARFVQKERIFDPILLPRPNAKLIMALLGRGMSGSVVTLALTGAVKFIGIGDTMVLKSSSSLIVIFFASCFLNEPLRAVPIICGIQIILGVFCIAKPPFMTGQAHMNTDTLIGTGLGLSLALAASMSIIVNRYLRNVHFSFSALAMGIFGSLSTGIICAVTNQYQFPDDLLDVGYFLASAICTAVTQILTVIGLKYAKAGQGSIVRSSEVLFGFLLEITILGAVPDQLSALGAIVIVLAVTMAAVTRS